MYETTFEFYIPRNILHKVKLLRYKLKEILKHRYYKEENYINSNGNKAVYRRADYSFAIGIIGFSPAETSNGTQRMINNKNGAQKGGLLVVKVRTAVKMYNEVQEQIKKTIFGQTEKLLREKNKYYNDLKENRIKVMVDNNGVKRLVPTYKAKILVSSPLFYDLTNAKVQEQRPGYSVGKVFDYSEKLKEIKQNAEVLKNKLNKAIQLKYQITDAISIINMEHANTAYVQFYKENKYDKIGEHRGEYKDYLQRKKDYIEKMKCKLKQTTIHGLKNILITFNSSLTTAELEKIYLHGIGGKNGLGMGFLWPE